MDKRACISGDLNLGGVNIVFYHVFLCSFDENSLKIVGKVDVPDLYLEGDYVIDGRALLVPIKGNGLFTANLSE